MKKLIFMAALVLAGCGETDDEKHVAKEKAYLERKLLLSQRCEAARKAAYAASLRGDEVQSAVWTEMGNNECSRAESY